MSSTKKKRLIITVVISTTIYTALQYFWIDDNTSTSLKIIVGSCIFALVTAIGMYWLLMREQNKQQTQTKPDHTPE